MDVWISAGVGTRRGLEAGKPTAEETIVQVTRRAIRVEHSWGRLGKEYLLINEKRRPVMGGNAYDFSITTATNEYTLLAIEGFPWAK